MTKSQHNILCCALLLFSAGAKATSFECLRELLPITENAKLSRAGFGAPVVVNGKFLVFPELTPKRVTGFFIYLNEHAWYYDAAGEDPIAELSGIFDLVAQPTGLETVTIRHPASGVGTAKLLHMSTRTTKTGTELHAPLESEVAGRKAWVRNHNLNQESFRRLTRVMDSVCR